MVKYPLTLSINGAIGRTLAKSGIHLNEEGER